MSAAMDPFEIFGDLASGNCLKVKYTADFLALPYRWTTIDIMRGESRTPAFLQLNPSGQVPVIRLADGRALGQSNAILRFIAKGSTLLPEDPFAQAKIDEWLFWEQYNHEPYIAVCRFHMHYLGKSKETRDPVRVQRGEQALDFMNARLENRAWLSGETMSVADISLLAYTRLAGEGGFDLTTRKNVLAWIERSENALQLQPLAAAAIAGE